MKPGKQPFLQFSVRSSLGLDSEIDLCCNRFVLVVLVAVVVFVRREMSR